MFTLEYLNVLSYREIQKLAKSSGIKANQTKCDLINSIIQAQDNVCPILNSTYDVNFSSNSVFGIEKNEHFIVSPKDNILTKSVKENFTQKSQNKSSFSCKRLDHSIRRLNSTSIEASCIKKNYKKSKSSISNVQFTGSELSKVATNVTPTELIRKSLGRYRKTPASRSTITTEKQLKKYPSSLVTIRRERTVKGTDSPSFKKGFSAETLIPRPIKCKEIPNFARIHARQFEKMVSLDEYVANKEHRGKSQTSNKKMYSDSCLHPNGQKPGVKKFVFEDTKIPKKFNFGATDVTFKGSKDKVLSSVKVLKSSTISNSKPSKFDLKSSLKRQLSYKPHTGKLIDWAGQQKQVKTKLDAKNKTKEDIRANIKGVRLNRRAELLMKRRFGM